MMEPILDARWCADPAAATELASLFAASLDSDYISHSELQSTRALDIGVWSPNIEALVLEEIADRIDREGGRIAPGGESWPVMEARVDGRLVGVALVSFFLGRAVIPYAILEDLAVDRAFRNQGIGERLIDWISVEAVRFGCARVFLESGIGNHRAHRIFERKGFQPCSIVMMKPLANSL